MLVWNKVLHLCVFQNNKNIIYLNGIRPNKLTLKVLVIARTTFSTRTNFFIYF